MPAERPIVLAGTRRSGSHRTESREFVKAVWQLVISPPPDSYPVHKSVACVGVEAPYEANTAELSFMAHNIVLTMQAMGLGGLFLTGINRWSVLGAFADDGIAGLGFRFVDEERWTMSNPVGLDGMYEALCPPYQPDMRTAAQVFAERM